MRRQLIPAFLISGSIVFLSNLSKTCRCIAKEKRAGIGLLIEGQLHRFVAIANRKTLKAYSTKAIISQPY